MQYHLYQVKEGLGRGGLAPAAGSAYVRNGREMYGRYNICSSTEAVKATTLLSSGVRKFV